MREKSLLISILALALAATGLAGCSGGGDDDGAEIDSGLPQPVDGGVDGAVGCTIAANQKMFEPTATADAWTWLRVGDSTSTPPDPGTYLLFYSTGNPGTGSEVFRFIIDKPVELGTPIDLSKGYTGTSTYQLVIWGDYTTPSTGIAGEVYFVTEGTITIDTAGDIDGKFTGSFSDLTLQHQVLAPGGQGYAPAGDDCDVNVPASTFDFTVEAVPTGKSSRTANVPPMTHMLRSAN